MTQQPVDYILVGQGLAGSCLALQLLYRQKKIVVIDQPSPTSASRVAAGLFNPITGKVMEKTWLADDLFPYLEKFYRQAEAYTGSSFYHPMPLYRPFISIEEQNAWMGKSASADYEQYLEHIHLSTWHANEVHNPFGGLLLKRCGYLNTKNFIHAVRSTLRIQGALLEEFFDEDQLQFEAESVTYKGIGASSIVYCTGEQIRHSRNFSWLPIRALKGETLTISSPVSVNTIYNRGVYVVPDIWKVGATYAKDDLRPEITEAGKTELVEKLNELIAFPYRITGQEWGFRPTTPDRRPLLGLHPKYTQLAVFNGLGTKGVSLAPYFSEIFTDWLENGSPLNNAADLNRYKSLYWKSA
jgi:glycine/D-amino acid oxidase-like deaminating enzyme